MACGTDDAGPDAGPDVVTGDVQFADVWGKIDQEPPTVAIQTPFEGQIFQIGDPVPLVATVVDDFDLPASLTVTWHSSLDGELASVKPNTEGFALLDHPGMSSGNHIITASARDNSGKVAQDHVGVIINGPPAPAIVVIVPESPSTHDDLQASLSVPAIDPNRDQEDITYTWRWLRDGEDMDVFIPTVYSQKTARGQNWEVRVRAADPYGKAVESTQSVTIGNARPTCPLAVVLPSVGWTDTSFECACAGWSDGDPGDLPQDTCQWMVNGVLQEGTAACSLSPDATTKEGTVTCLLTPHDGTDPGDMVQSQSAVVLNSAPTKPTIALTPDQGGALSAFSCIVLEQSSDADGDGVSYETSWVVNGYVNPGTTSANVLPLNLLSSEGGPSARKGDALQCHVRATDGDLASTWIESETVSLSNTPPQDGLAFVVPAEATEADTIACETISVTDPDGDEVNWTYVWKVDGEVLEGETGSALGPYTLAAGTKVLCEATPHDGESSGEMVASKNLVTVANAPPTVPVLAIEAPDGAEGPVMCVLLEEPVDATVVTVTTEWLIGAGEPFEGNNVLEADAVSSCDLVSCRISASDGEETVFSEWTEILLPVGIDCENGDVCTSHACLPLGGCTSEQNTANCDDGDACTDGDACNAGICAGVVKSCDDSNPCTVDACDPTTGCTQTTDLDQCDDGDTCTVDSCNPQTGACSWIAVPDDSVCDADSNGCTMLDTCSSGVCVPGPPAPCSTGSTACKLLACQSTSAQTYTCESVFADPTVPCNDGFFCTVDDACNGDGACLGGPPRDCSQGQGACNIGLCDELNNTCKIIPREDGTTCDADGNGCTQNDGCLEGLCLAGSNADCSALDADCSQGSCTSLGAEGFECSLIAAPIGLPCEDGNACTVASSCNGAGTCVGVLEVDCESILGDQCKTSYCDPVAQGCVVVKVLDGTPCNDGDGCSSDDMCQNGLCLGQGDSCLEEVIDVAVRSNRRPALGGLGFGRFVTQWATSTLEHNAIRITDRMGSREAEERRLPGTKFAPPTFPLALATHLNGDFLALGNDGTYGCVNNANSDCQVQGAVVGALYDLAGSVVTSAILWSVEGEKGTGQGVTNYVVGQRVIPFSFEDSSWGALLMVTDNSFEETTPAKNRLHYVPIGEELVAGDLVEVLGPGVVFGDRFDAERVSEDGLLVAWVDAGQTSIVARHMDRFGSWTDEAVTVHQAILGHKITSVNLATDGADGAVIAWTLDTSDSPTPSTDVEALRVDSALVAQGPVIEVTGAKSQNQTLGDVDCFSDGGFVLVYEDEAGDVSGSGVLASRYGADDAPLGKALVHVDVFDDQRLPAVLVLPDDEYVVAYLGPYPGRVYTRRFSATGLPAPGAVERRATLTSEGSRSHGDAAADNSGSALVVVQSPFEGNLGTDIVARLYSVGGDPLTVDTMVNDAVEGDQIEPAVAGGDGGFVVVWVETSANGGSNGIYGRLVGSNGEAASDVFTVALTGTIPSSPDVVRADDGRFLVTWTEVGAVYARGFEADAVAAAPMVEVDSLLSVGQSHSRVAGELDDGKVVIAWMASPDPAAQTRIYARRFSLAGTSDGAPVELGGGEVASATQDQPAISRGSDSAGLACWHSSVIAPGKSKNGVGCQRFDELSLSAIGPVFALHDQGAPGDFSAPAITSLANGHFMVAFQIEEVDGDEHAIQAQQISSIGAFSGSRVVVNRTWAGDQTAPFLASIVGVGTPYVIGWVSTEGQSQATDVYLRVLKAE